MNCNLFFIPCVKIAITGTIYTVIDTIPLEAFYFEESDYFLRDASSSKAARTVALLTCFAILVFSSIGPNVWERSKWCLFFLSVEEQCNHHYCLDKTL